MFMRMEVSTIAGLLLSLAAAFSLAEDAPVQTKPATTAESKTAVEIVLDISEAPELKDFGERAKAASEKWFPLIVEKLPSEGFVPAQHVTIVFKKDYKGVAMTQGTRVTCAVKYFTDHPDDVGAVIHEMVHVVQAYHKPVPTWLTEGIADFVRFFSYEPVNRQPHPSAARAKYNASYQTSAAFLHWVTETFDKEFVVKMNAACRKGKYDDNLWKEFTGKTAEELGAAWVESLKKPAEKKPDEKKPEEKKPDEKKPEEKKP
jgi:hypothetical protein